MSNNKEGVYALMKEVRSAIASLDIIYTELSKPEYTTSYSSERMDTLKQKKELVRVLDALNEIESSLYSHHVSELTKQFPDLKPSTPDGHRVVQNAVAKHTSNKDIPEITKEDIKSDALIGTTSQLVDEIHKSISPDLSTMLSRITKIETDIEKLQSLVIELKQRAASVKEIPSATGLLSRLQDTITLASQVTGTVTIRGVKHTIETFEATEPVTEMFTKRFQNLSKTNLVTRIKHLHKDAAEKVNGTILYGSTTLKEYKTLRTSEGDTQVDASSSGVKGNITLPEPYRFISLVPTSPLSLGLPADKSFASVLQDVTEQVKNKTYTFRTHDPVTYEETDTGNDIVFDMSGVKRKSPSYLEEAILRLSLEHLDVIHKYLLSTQNTTRGYVAILPCSVFGMKLSTKLFHYKDSRKFSKATGKENEKSIKDLVLAYNVMEDERKQLPHIAYTHTDKITYPIYNLEYDSEKVYSSNLMKTISTLGQIYVRFSRKSEVQPFIKIGLQDTITGNAVVYDFPNFKISHVYNAFNELDSTITKSEATR